MPCLRQEPGRHDRTDLACHGQACHGWLDTTKAITLSGTDIDNDALTYAVVSAPAHGTLSGEASQTVDYGVSGTSVTAVPDAHYHFVSWSDASTTASRTDSNVTGDVSVTATFAANDVYVDPAAGLDTNDGYSVGSPVQTLAYAFSIVPSGGTIHLAGAIPEDDDFGSALMAVAAWRVPHVFVA